VTIANRATHVFSNKTRIAHVRERVLNRTGTQNKLRQTFYATFSQIVCRTHFLGERMPYCWKCGTELDEDAKFCPACGTAVVPLTEPEERRMRKERPQVSKEIAKIAAIVVISIIVIGLVVGLLPTLFHVGREFGQTINPPNVEITSRSIRTGLDGLDYVAWVDVSVHNHGGPGTIVVWAEIRQGSSSWKKSMSIYLESQESRDLTFTFREVGFWTTETIYYRVWVT